MAKALASPDQQIIDRKRAIAMALQQASMQPLQSPGVRGAVVSPFEGINKIAQALMAGYQNNQLDQQQAGLTAQNDRARLAQALSISNSVIPPSQGLPAAMAQPQEAAIPGENAVAPVSTPPVMTQLPVGSGQVQGRDNSVSALAQALSSQDPMIQKQGEAMLQNQLISGREAATQKAESDRAQMARQQQQEFERGQQARSQAFSGAQTDKSLAAQAANQNIDPLSPEGITAQQQLQQTKPGPSDPYGERIVVRDGNEYIQTYAKADPQAPTLSERLKGPVPVSSTANTADSTSYKFHVAEIDKRAKPLDDSAARFSRLKDTIAQGTAQADALIAPELMTVIAGGLGSGVRITESEINRVQGGRPKIAQIQAKLRSWMGTDQKSAINFGPDERKAINDLLDTVGTKLQQKQAALTAASEIVSGDKTTDQQRRTALADLDKQLRAIDGGKAATEPGKLDSILNQLFGPAPKGK